VRSDVLEGGIASTGAPNLKVPTKFGVPLQPLRWAQPGAGPETSIASATVRPKVGEPHTRMSSFVCSGPSIRSTLANVIELHGGSVRPAYR
jgi:hypothetical protein